MDAENTLVLMGSGATAHEIGNMVPVSSVSKMTSLYGDCLLTHAYKEASILGAPDIRILNIKRPQDYPKVIRSLSQCDVGFICPVDIYMKDHIDLDYGSWLWPRLILDVAGFRTLSTFVMTMPHASLYENGFVAMDAARKVMQEYWNLSGVTSGQNMMFVLNNLKNFQFANVALAAAWCLVPVAEYPSGNWGDSIYNYDMWDVGNDEIGYFRSWKQRTTTVENLVNLLPVAGPLKSGHVDRMIKHIKRTLEFSEFIGKPATEYLRLKVEDKLLGYLEAWKGELIDAYGVTGVEWDKSSVPGVKILRCHYWILPRFSQSKTQLILEV